MLKFVIETVTEHNPLIPCGTKPPSAWLRLRPTAAGAPSCTDGTMKPAAEGNKMVIIYWTCGGVAKVAIIVTVRSQIDQTNHLAASRKFDFPEI